MATKKKRKDCLEAGWFRYTSRADVSMLNNNSRKEINWEKRKKILRLDVDHACFNKCFSCIRLVTGSAIRSVTELVPSLEMGLAIPHFHDHVKVVKKYLDEHFPRIHRIWMFRPETCPKSWDEDFGLHSRGFYYFPREYKVLRARLGPFKYFNRHGFGPLASGTLWTPAMVRTIEEKFNVIDLGRFPALSIDLRPELVTKAYLKTLHHINFHPSHFYTHKKILQKALNIIQEINDSLE